MEKDKTALFLGNSITKAPTGNTVAFNMSFNFHGDGLLICSLCFGALIHLLLSFLFKIKTLGENREHFGLLTMMEKRLGA